MRKYHKIKTVLLRDPENNYKTLIDGEFATPELNYLRTNEWIFTEKVDGTNIRVMWDHGQAVIRLRGKTDKAEIPGFLLDRLQDIFSVEQFSELYPETSICLYGEGYGAKIQKGGGNYRQDQGFVLFDVRIGGWWLQTHNIADVALKLKIEIIPIIGEGTLYDMIRLAQRGFKSKWGDFVAEGIVARPRCEMMTRNGSRIITKVKHKDFPQK